MPIQNTGGIVLAVKTASTPLIVWPLVIHASGE
jgi:hypothetical protein